MTLTDSIEINPVVYAEHLLLSEQPLPELHECQKEFLRRMSDDNPAGNFRDDDK